RRSGRGLAVHGRGRRGRGGAVRREDPGRRGTEPQDRGRRRVVHREGHGLTVSRKDVVVTGLGATTPLGGDVASTWEAMVAGRSGVSALTQDWAAPLPVRIVASMKVDPSAVTDRVKLRRLDRSEAAALIAAHQAWADAGL